LLLVVVQIYLGALVAGLRAGLLYNTWPSIDGSFIPNVSRLFFNSPWWRNFFENALTVQFDHRMMAYGVLGLTLIHLVNVVSAGGSRTARDGVLALTTAVTLQALLGIVTLLHQAPLALALMHQAMAMVVLTVAVIHAERLNAPRTSTAITPERALRSES
jgi:cytochrome c oxidase assembly protein subunit 15